MQENGEGLVGGARKMGRKGWAAHAMLVLVCQRPHGKGMCWAGSGSTESDASYPSVGDTQDKRAESLTCQETLGWQKMEAEAWQGMRRACWYRGKASYASSIKIVVLCTLAWRNVPFNSEGFILLNVHKVRVHTKYLTFFAGLISELKPKSYMRISLWLGKVRQVERTAYLCLIHKWSLCHYGPIWLFGRRHLILPTHPICPDSLASGLMN